MFPKPSKTNRADASLPCVPCNRTSGKWRVSSAPVLQTAVADVRTYKVKWSIICETKPCSFSLWSQPWIYPAGYHKLSAETCLVSQTWSKSAGINLPTSTSLPCAPCNRACMKRSGIPQRLIFIYRPTFQKQAQQPSIASATCNSRAAELIFLTNRQSSNHCGPCENLQSEVEHLYGETQPCSFSLWPQPWIYPADYHSLSAETCLVSQTRSKSAGSNLPTSSSLPCAPCNRACRKRGDPLHRLIFICRPTIQKQTQQPSIASATCNSKAAEQLIIFLSYTTSICLSSLK